MTLVWVCVAIAILSILFLIGWFFHAIEVAQQHIDRNSE